MTDDPPPEPRPDAFHVPLGCVLTGLLVAATPASLALAMWGVLAALSSSGVPIHASAMLPAAVVYGWVVTMGLGQAVVVAPAAVLALVRGRRACVVGMAVGAVLVVLANAGALVFFAMTGSFGPILSGFEMMW